MKSLLWHTPIVLKQMIRLPAFILLGCAISAGLIVFEFGSISSHRPSPAARLPSPEIASAAPEIPKPADPLSSPTQRGPETGSSANDADSALRDVRLTGVVIGPDLRIAIFAVAGANSRVLSEGEALKGWRLESISSERVVLSSPAGNITLGPQPDAKLVRPPPPVASQSEEPRTAMTGAQGPLVVVTPIAVGNLPAATPVQTQGYPHYSPEYYAGYDPDSGNSWGWGWPVAVSTGFGGCWNCGFRVGSFRPGFRRFGFGKPGFVHPGFARTGFAHASFSGGFRGGGRR